MTTIETSVQGIPCLAQVDSFKQVPGSFSHSAPSDLDYYGYMECSYRILDRNGYPAPWLERKLTDKDDDKIRTDIFNHFSN